MPVLFVLLSVSEFERISSSSNFLTNESKISDFLCFNLIMGIRLANFSFFFNFFLVFLVPSGECVQDFFQLSACWQTHSVFRAFVHAGTICLFLDP